MGKLCAVFLPPSGDAEGILPAQERAGAERAVAEIRSYCRGVARYLAGRRGQPPVEGAVAAARRIAAIARAKPEASYRGSQRARDLAADPLPNTVFARQGIFVP